VEADRRPRQREVMAAHNDDRIHARCASLVWRPRILEIHCVSVCPAARRAQPPLGNRPVAALHALGRRCAILHCVRSGSLHARRRRDRHPRAPGRAHRHAGARRGYLEMAAGGPVPRDPGSRVHRTQRMDQHHRAGELGVFGPDADRESRRFRDRSLAARAMVRRPARGPLARRVTTEKRDLR